MKQTFRSALEADVPAWRKTIRAELIAARLALPETAWRQACDAITARLLLLLSPVQGRTIGFYWPHRREYDPLPVASWIIDQGGGVALPVVAGKGLSLEFRSWRPGASMNVGAHGIPHPADGPTVIPDVLVVPTVGFDAACYRLGYGGGYYDRTLASQSRRPTTIGVAFEMGRLDSILPQQHDIMLDMMVTEAALQIAHATGK